MAEWQDALTGWAAGWLAVQGRTSAVEGNGVVAVPDVESQAEYILAWPGTGVDDVAALVLKQPGAVLTLATTEPGKAREYAGARGLAVVGEAALLAARTDDLDSVPALPEDAQLAEAPLELYDVVEISVFDHPVASGRISIQEGLAVIGGVRTQSPDDADHLGAAVVAALADEAGVHGAGTLYTVIDPQGVAGYTASGWAPTAVLLSFGAPS
ncbi:hypothetical protein [Pseudarthrobacter sp. H2]|uniref:hypothetical protein n=1 Tax=Pseudarthrobacter sp. H2 TaxID=3418415 RepID=UPI003CF57E8E